MPAHLKLGRRGEDIARRYLTSLGYEILAVNWRKWRWELDIVCLDKDELVFVEVKTRSSCEHGLPGQAVDKNKASALVKAAGLFLTDRNWWHRPCRFDLVSVLFSDTGISLEHEENIVDFSLSVGRGHTSWQPW
jgi:putative endonuclease